MRQTRGRHDASSFLLHTHTSHCELERDAEVIVRIQRNAKISKQVRKTGSEGATGDSEQQAHRGMTLNPATIHSDPDDIVTLGLSSDQEVQPDRGLTLNLDGSSSTLSLADPGSSEIRIMRWNTSDSSDEILCE
jgi:hypothetical protein